MPGGIQLGSSTADASRANFREYLKWNRRETERLVVDDYRKLATDLYVETAKIAPSRAEIATEVKALGWRIPKKFRDGRLGRGVPAQWLGHALIKRNKLIRKRGRKSKRDHLAEEAFMAMRPTLLQMQQFVIANRVNATLFLASGWLGAVADLGGSLKSTSGKVDHSRGGASIRRGIGIVEVTFWNRTPGIETMQAKTDFVGKAIQRRIADRQVYIDRKKSEDARRLERKAA